MGTEILRPQDCLIDRIRGLPVISPRRRNYCANFNSNPRSNRKSTIRQERKRFGSGQSEPSITRRSSSSDDLRGVKNGMVMEKVTLLRRGESLDSKIKSIVPAAAAATARKEGDDLAVCKAERLGPDPDPEMVPKQIRRMDLRSPVAWKSDVYAGSAIFVSPAPSSLPLPSFSKKKQVMASFDDSATRDLRRLLRLD